MDEVKPATKADEFRAPETASQTAARIHGSAQSVARGGAQELTFQAMGTRCRISFAAPANRVRDLQKLALDWVAAFEAKYSRFLPNSLISQINAAAGVKPILIDAETEKLFALCDQMHFMTRGVFDPSSLPLLRAWNWKREQIPTDGEIAAALRLVGWRKVQRKPGQIFLPEPGMGIDLGGMGKEYAVDCVAQLLAANGAQSILVDFGADVRVMGIPADGRPGWHIGLDDPRTPGKCWCGLGVRESGVATSGDYLRRFEVNGRRYGHIIDVRTGQPVQNDCRAVSVMAPSCTQAGMISTAVFVLGPSEGMTLLDMPGVAGAIVTANNVLASRRFYEYVVS
jgi:thiamine biosynthesis lipoprotein